MKTALKFEIGYGTKSFLFCRKSIELELGGAINEERHIYIGCISDVDLDVECWLKVSEVDAVLTVDEFHQTRRLHFEELWPLECAQNVVNDLKNSGWNVKLDEKVLGQCFQKRSKNTRSYKAIETKHDALCEKLDKLKKRALNEKKLSPMSLVWNILQKHLEKKKLKAEAEMEKAAFRYCQWDRAKGVSS